MMLNLLKLLKTFIYYHSPTNTKTINCGNLYLITLMTFLLMLNTFAFFKIVPNFFILSIVLTISYLFFMFYIFRKIYNVFLPFIYTKIPNFCVYSYVGYTFSIIVFISSFSMFFYSYLNISILTSLFLTGLFFFMLVSLWFIALKRTIRHFLFYTTSLLVITLIFCIIRVTGLFFIMQFTSFCAMSFLQILLLGFACYTTLLGILLISFPRVSIKVIVYQYQNTVGGDLAKKLVFFLSALLGLTVRVLTFTLFFQLDCGLAIGAIGYFLFFPAKLFLHEFCIFLTEIANSSDPFDSEWSSLFLLNFTSDLEDFSQADTVREQNYVFPTKGSTPSGVIVDRITLASFFKKKLSLAQICDGALLPVIQSFQGRYDESLVPFFKSRYKMQNATEAFLLNRVRLDFKDIKTTSIHSLDYQKSVIEGDWDFESKDEIFIPATSTYPALTYDDYTSYLCYIRLKEARDVLVTYHSCKHLGEGEYGWKSRVPFEEEQHNWFLHPGNELALSNLVDNTGHLVIAYAFGMQGPKFGIQAFVSEVLPIAYTIHENGLERTFAIADQKFNNKLYSYNNMADIMAVKNSTEVQMTQIKTLYTHKIPVQSELTQSDKNLLEKLKQQSNFLEDLNEVDPELFKTYSDKTHSILKHISNFMADTRNMDYREGLVTNKLLINVADRDFPSKFRKVFDAYYTSENAKKTVNTDTNTKYTPPGTVLYFSKNGQLVFSEKEALLTVEFTDNGKMAEVSKDIEIKKSLVTPSHRTIDDVTRTQGLCDRFVAQTSDATNQQRIKKSVVPNSSEHAKIMADFHDRRLQREILKSIEDFKNKYKFK